MFILRRQRQVNLKRENRIGCRPAVAADCRDKGDDILVLKRNPRIWRDAGRRIEGPFLYSRTWLTFPVKLHDRHAKSSIGSGLYPEGTMQPGAVLIPTISSRVEKLKETVSENTWVMGEDRRDVVTFINLLLDRQTANGQNDGAAW